MRGVPVFTNARLVSFLKLCYVLVTHLSSAIVTTYNHDDHHHHHHQHHHHHHHQQQHDPTVNTRTPGNVVLQYYQVMQDF